MRGVVLLATLGACSFTPGNAPGDAVRIDVPPDMQVVPTWSVDPASSKGVPDSATGWNELIAAYGLGISPPDHLWRMQESGGNLADAIGSVALAPLNGPSYQNTVPGWTRVSVGTFDVSYDQGFVTNTTGNTAGTSYLFLLYVSIAAPPSAERSLCGLGGGGDHRFVGVTPNPVFEGGGIGVTAVDGTVDPKAAVHPILLGLDATHATYTVYTDQEKIVVPWKAPTGTGALVSVGNAANGAASARYLYGALWSGAHAELSDTTVKSILHGLGWAVTGY